MEKLESAVARAREMQRRLDPRVPTASGRAALEASSLASGRVSSARGRDFLPLQEAVLSSGELCVPLNRDGAEGFRVLRTRILQRLSAYGWNTAAVVSPAAGDGRTFTVLNLALALAEDEQHTVLAVDLNLRRPVLHQRLGVPVEQGIDHYLEGHIDALDSLFVTVGSERLALLPCSSPIPSNAAVLASERCRQAVEEVKSRYSDRVILFDLPPLLEDDAAIAFLPNVDGVIMVVCEGRNTGRSSRSHAGCWAIPPFFPWC